MTRRTRVYVAGPISKGDIEENVRRAIQVGLDLLDAGYAPFIPHLSHQAAPSATCGTVDYQKWLALDRSFILCCDALLRLPGDSAGADEEEAWARRWGIPVFESAALVMAAFPPEVEI